MSTMNVWEQGALQYQYPETSDGTQLQARTATAGAWSTTSAPPGTFDSVIYPGLYSASGFDVMGILLRVFSRPHPQVELGAIDASCPLVLCDLLTPDNPIVYASDSFLQLTGYTRAEVVGKNCRFLQAPGGKVKPRSPRKHVDPEIRRKMRRAITDRKELQIEVTNFKKNGQKFTNVLSVIPVQWESHEHSYAVGFQSEKEE